MLQAGSTYTSSRRGEERCLSPARAAYTKRGLSLWHVQRTLSAVWRTHGEFVARPLTSLAVYERHPQKSQEDRGACSCRALLQGHVVGIGAASRQNLRIHLGSESQFSRQVVGSALAVAASCEPANLIRVPSSGEPSAALCDSRWRHGQAPGSRRRGSIRACRRRRACPWSPAAPPPSSLTAGALARRGRRPPS